MPGWKWLAVVTVLLLPVSCSVNRDQRRPYLIMENMDNAARHLEQGQKEEAAQIYQVVLLADPSNAEAQEALDSIADYDRSIAQPSRLGKNLVKNPKTESDLLWFLFYPVNRVLDVLDVVSVSAGLQGGFYLDGHVTRGAQASFGAAGGMQMGWWQKRELAVGAGHFAGTALVPISVEGEGCTRIGTRGIRNASFSVVGLNEPTDYVYQEHRDYWGVGFRIVALVAGAEFEFHPVELADAVSGIFFVDFLRDDIGRTKPLRLSRADTEAMEDLMATMSH